MNDFEIIFKEKLMQQEDNQPCLSGIKSINDETEELWLELSGEAAYVEDENLPL